MSVQVLEETTKWKYPNHIYVLNSSGKMLGYHSVQHGWQVFNRPLLFEKRYRSFKKIDMPLPAQLQDAKDELPAGAVKIVGSRGAVYIIHEGTCTCSGFKWRGKCKHIQEVKKNQRLSKV